MAYLFRLIIWPALSLAAVFALLLPQWSYAAIPAQPGYQYRFSAGTFHATEAAAIAEYLAPRPHFSFVEPIDTSTPMGTFVLQILGAVAQLERSIIRERVIAGQTAAMARGKRWGPPRTLSARAESSLVRLYLRGGHTYSSVARHFDVSPGVARCAVLRVVDPNAYYTPRR